MAEARVSMELIGVNDGPCKLTAIGGRSDTNRQNITAAVKATNQMGAFQNLKGQWFEITFKAVTMCNFPVTMVKCNSKIPKIGTTDAKDVPEETYLFIEEQAEWCTKYLTKGWSKEVKMEGYIVASNPTIYQDPRYFESMPEAFLQCKTYKEYYKQKYANNYPSLKDEWIKEEYYVLKCNSEVVDQVDYNEHCAQLHGIEPTRLRGEQHIKFDSKVPFKLEPALDIENVGTEDHNNILHTWFTKGTQQLSPKLPIKLK